MPLKGGLSEVHAPMRSSASKAATHGAPGWDLHALGQARVSL